MLRLYAFPLLLLATWTTMPSLHLFTLCGYSPLGSDIHGWHAAADDCLSICFRSPLLTPIVSMDDFTNVDRCQCFVTCHPPSPPLPFPLPLRGSTLQVPVCFVWARRFGLKTGTGYFTAVSWTALLILTAFSRTRRVVALLGRINVCCGTLGVSTNSAVSESVSKLNSKSRSILHLVLRSWNGPRSVEMLSGISMTLCAHALSVRIEVALGCNYIACRAVTGQLVMEAFCLL
jgi:hypothetical protein